MDIPDFVKHLSLNQKDVVFSFIIVSPIYYTLLCIFVDSFCSLEPIFQFAITITISIISLSFSFTMIGIASIKTNIHLINVMMLTAPSIHFSAFILFIKFFSMNYSIELIMYIIFNFIPFLTILFLFWKDKRKKISPENE